MRCFSLGAIGVCAMATSALAITIQPLAGLPSNNSDPQGNLIMDSAGDIFGTTTLGGTNNEGSLFELPAGGNAIHVIASFGGTAGSNPTFINFDASGNIYGTTLSGTIFKVAQNSSTIQTVASFGGSVGTQPVGPIVFDSSGNLFGTTSDGGTNSAGTVFELPANSSTISTVASFAGGAGGSNPNSVVVDSAGNLYGTTDRGGNAGTGSSSAGYGTIYKIAAGSGTVQTLFAFSQVNDTQTNGEGPGSIIRDSTGNLYGVTTQGGNSNSGTIFELPVGQADITTLANFDGSNGTFPQGIVFDSSGNLFGTASYSGQSGNIDAPGTVFAIPAGSNQLVSVTLNDATAGARPFDEMVADGNGDLFGLTAADGLSGNGEIFEVRIPEPATFVLLAGGLVLGWRKRSGEK